MPPMVLGCRCLVYDAHMLCVLRMAHARYALLVQAHITAAWRAFNSILSTWPEEPLDGFEACTAAARRELEAAVTAAKAMAVHAVQAAIEAERANAAVGEREKLRMEMIMESQQLAALADSVQAYKQGINCHVRKGCNEPELRDEHEVSLVGNRFLVKQCSLSCDNLCTSQCRHCNLCVACKICHESGLGIHELL